MTPGPWRFVLTRFVPGCALVVGGALFGRLLDDPTTFGWEHWLLGAVEIGGLATGFGGVLGLLKERMLRERHRPWGPASLAAGMVASLGLGLTSILAQGTGMAGIAFASVATGAVMGGLLALPWLRPWAVSSHEPLERADGLRELGRGDPLAPPLPDAASPRQPEAIWR